MPAPHPCRPCGVRACLLGTVPWLVALAAGLPSHAGAVTPANVLLARGRTEPAIAIDRAAPATVIVGSNTNYSAPVNGTYPVASFVSHDSGRTFHAATVPQSAPYTTGADPSVASVTSGTLFYSYLGETPTYCSGGRSAVVLTASYDRGASFRSPTVVDTNAADDKPAMAVRSIRAGHAHVFLSWTRWYNRSSEIWFSRSTDGGFGFSAPQRVYGSTLDNFGSQVAVGPHHRVLVVWARFAERGLTSTASGSILMRVSSNDGRSFGPVRTVVPSFKTLPPMAAPGSLRNLPGPAVSIDRHGAVYVAWTTVSHAYADGTVNSNIEIERSADAGVRWSRPLRVNDVSGGDRFMPSLSTMSDGSVGVAFYDRRRSRWNLDTYAARVTFDPVPHVSANVRVNQRDSPISDIYYIAPGSTCFSPGRFFGDYIGTAPGPDNRLCVVWSDAGLHVQDETDVWFASVALPPVSGARQQAGGREATSEIGVRPEHARGG